LQIVDADLTHVFGSGARPANFDLFETAAGAGLPGEDGEGDFAHSAFLAVGFFGHADVGVVAEAGFADEREFCLLPFLFVVVAFDCCAHGVLGCNLKK
jgi:hypothetical protein